MFGYRIFKISGSLLILILTQWTAIASGYAELSWVILGFCLLWILVLINIYSEYKSLITATILRQ
jgi:AAA family ATP:ADP antiporter